VHEGWPQSGRKNHGFERGRNPPDSTYQARRTGGLPPGDTLLIS
jgi:hypothetical protein